MWSVYTQNFYLFQKYVVFLMGSILVSLSIGQVSSVLTAFEFVSVSIAALILPYLVDKTVFFYERRDQDVWLFKARNLRLWIQFMGVPIAVWFTICTALVQSRLQTQRVISSRTMQSRRWVSMTNKSEEKSRDRFVVIPQHIEIDEDTINAAKILPCNDGIDSISFGLATRIENGKYPFVYPNCIGSSKQNGNEGILEVSDLRYDFANLKTVYVDPPGIYGYSIIFENSWIIISPYPSNSFPMNETLTRGENNLSIKNISSLSKDLFSRYTPSSSVVLGLKDMSMKHIIFSKVYDEYQPISTTLDPNQLVSCLSKTSEIDSSLNAGIHKSTVANRAINISCLHENVSRRKDYVNTVQFEDVSVILNHEMYLQQGIACSDAIVQMGYMVLPEELFKQHESSNNSVLLPFHVKILSGTCERMDEYLGLLSMLYSTNSEWTSENKRFELLSRHQRYHAFMIGMARKYFPYDTLYSKKSSSVEFPISEDRTEIKKDPAFALMLVVFLVCVLVVLINVILFLFLPRNLQKIRFPSTFRSQALGELSQSTKSDKLKSPLK